MRTARRRLHPTVRPMLTIVLVAVALLVAPRAAGACSCAPPPALPERVGAADVAVVGTVVEVRDRPNVDRDGFPIATVAMILDVEAVVAGDATTPADGSVEQLAVHTDRSSCGISVQPGGRRGFVARRDRDGLLVAGGCGGSVDPDELLGVEVDLPQPSARGPADHVTIAAAGPSSLQLRDPAGAVVAWGALPTGFGAASICPGGAKVLGTRWRPGGDGTLQLVVADVRTSASHDLSRLGLERPDGSPRCVTADAGIAVVAVDATPIGDSELVVLRTDSGAELQRMPIGGPMEIAVTPDGTVVVASASGIETVDLDSGERTSVAPIAEGRRVRALIAHADGGLSALVSGGTELSPIDELLTIGRELTGASPWPIEPSGEVVGIALGDGGTRILAMREGTLRVHDATGRHLDTVAEAPPSDWPWSSGEVWLGLTAEGSPTYDVERPDVVSQVLLQRPTEPPLTAPLAEPFTPAAARAAVRTRTALQVLATGASPDQSGDEAPPGGSPAPGVDGAADAGAGTDPSSARNPIGADPLIAGGAVLVVIAVAVLVARRSWRRPSA